MIKLELDKALSSKEIKNHNKRKINLDNITLKISTNIKTESLSLNKTQVEM